MKKIIKAKGMAKEFKNFLLKKMKEDEYESYRYQYLLEEDFSKFLLVVTESNKILDIISFGEEYGRTIYYPFFLHKDENEVLRALRNFDSNAIINVDYYHEELCFYKANIRSSINWDNSYVTRTGSFFCAKEEDINFLRNYMEEKYFPRVDVSNLTFKVINQDDFEKLFRNSDGYYDEWKNLSNHYNIIGFHYLKPEDLFENQKMLLAFAKDTLVGVIKYGIYDKGEKYERVGLNYIDVNEAYRHQGVAKKLISALSDELGEEIPLVLTDESDMGHFCHMVDNFKKAHFRCSVYTRPEWEEHWLGGN